MYKILHYEGLGIGNRQNELIELALTYGFGAVEVDMADLLGRHEMMGKEFACQFLLSANMDMGTFELPVDFGCSDEAFKRFEAQLDTIIDLASTLHCKVCYVRIKPTSLDTSFQENFERHRTRLNEIADKFAAANIRIGLLLQASKVHSSRGDHKFIQNAEELLQLVKTVGHNNVGICLDTFEWQVGGGAMDQISELDQSLFTEIRLGDINPEADPNDVEPSDKILPGDAEGSMVFKLMAFLVEGGYDGAVSVATNGSMFKGKPREKFIELISKRIDRLVAQEDIHDPEPEEEPAEGEESAEASAGENGAESSSEESESKSEGNESSEAKETASSSS